MIKSIDHLVLHTQRPILSLKNSSINFELDQYDNFRSLKSVRMHRTSRHIRIYTFTIYFITTHNTSTRICLLHVHTNFSCLNNIGDTKFVILGIQYCTILGNIGVVSKEPFTPLKYTNYLYKTFIF